MFYNSLNIPQKCSVFFVNERLVKYFVVHIFNFVCKLFRIILKISSALEFIQDLIICLTTTTASPFTMLSYSYMQSSFGKVFRPMHPT